MSPVCRIFDKKSVAPSSGDFGSDRCLGSPGEKIGNFEEKIFV